MDIATHFIERREPRADRPSRDGVGRAGGGRRGLPAHHAGNGELFARLYGDRVRFDHRRRRWLVWAGHWWRTTTPGGAAAGQDSGAPPRYAARQRLQRLNERAAESRSRRQREPPAAGRTCWPGTVGAADQPTPATVLGPRPLVAGRGQRRGRPADGHTPYGLPEDRITLHSRACRSSRTPAVHAGCASSMRSSPATRS